MIDVSRVLDDLNGFCQLPVNFGEDGSHIPVTVLKLDSVHVVAQRTSEKDGYTAVQLGVKVIKKCIEHSNLKSNEIDTVFMGQVLQTGSGQNPARQASIQAGLPVENAKKFTVDVCLEKFHYHYEIESSICWNKRRTKLIRLTKNVC